MTLRIGFGYIGFSNMNSWMGNKSRTPFPRMMLLTRQEDKDKLGR
jgi:hypothetical protein